CPEASPCPLPMKLDSGGLTSWAVSRKWSSSSDTSLPFPTPSLPLTLLFPSQHLHFL
ncbi:hypothetical protein Pcinc_040997, partial [Petrolisthes cinctipes]